MKTIKSIAIIFIFCFSASGQITKDDLDKELKTLNQKIISLQSDNKILKNNSEDLNKKLKTSNNSINILEKRNKELFEQIAESKKEISVRIDTMENTNSGRITQVSQSISEKTLLGIIAFLSTIILSFGLSWLFIKRQKLEKIEFANQLNDTKSIIEENIEKEFEKQSHVVEAQIRLIEHQMSNIGTSNSPNQDHSLALKVADEITLIERTISLMDSGTKGLKQLSKSLEKIKDNLSSNGYEIPVLLGKPFNQGMKIIPVSTIQDENLEAGVEIISKIIKPQVNFNDKMIQAAQIEVSVGQ